MLRVDNIDLWNTINMCAMAGCMAGDDYSLVLGAGSRRLDDADSYLSGQVLRWMYDQRSGFVVTLRRLCGASRPSKDGCMHSVEHIEIDRGKVWIIYV
jgi:hypothetical protein